jgi:hypothetical protein
VRSALWNAGRTADFFQVAARSLAAGAQMMRKKMVYRWVALAMAGGLFLAGCTKGDPNAVKTVSVSGTITVGGQPMEGVEVRFVTEKFEGYGKTDSQGRYDLVAGAQPGQNKVFFSKMSGGSSSLKLNPDAGIDEEQIRASQATGGAGLDVARELIPEDFSSREKTQVTFNVPEGGTTSADFKVPGK